MAVKYTTAAKVRSFIGGYCSAADSVDAVINVWIEEAEAIVDCWLKIGTGTGSNSLTFSAAKKPHLVLEFAATAIAASIVMSHASVSTQTMEEANFIMDMCIYWYEQAKYILTDEQSISDFIIEQ